MTTEETLMQCVVKSVAKLGFENASIKSIAQEAGLSASTIYCHYPSKEALFESTFMYLAGIFCRFYSADVSKLVGNSKEESCHNLWDYYVRFYMDNDAAALFYTRYRHSAYYLSEIRERVEAFEASFFRATESIAENIGFSNKNGCAAVIFRFFAEAVLLYVEQTLTGKAKPEHNELAFKAIYAAMRAIEASCLES